MIAGDKPLSDHKIYYSAGRQCWSLCRWDSGSCVRYSLLRDCFRFLVAVCLLRLAAFEFQSRPTHASRLRVGCLAEVLHFTRALDTQGACRETDSSPPPTTQTPLQVPHLILLFFHLSSLHIHLLCLQVTGCFDTPNGQSFRNRSGIPSDDTCIWAEPPSACTEGALEFVKLGNSTPLLILSCKANCQKSR